MSGPLPVPFVVTGAPTTPGAASSISYSIDANFPTGVQPLSGIQPHTDRPDDSIDTQPVKIGTFGMAYEMGGILQVQLYEREATGPCSSGIAGFTNEIDRLIMLVRSMSREQKDALREALNA